MSRILLTASSPAQRGEKRAELIPAAGLGIAVRGQHDQPRGADARGQVPHQPKRRRIRPVHVVEHDEQAVISRRLCQEFADRLEQLESSLGWGVRRCTWRDLRSWRDHGQVGTLGFVRLMDCGDVADELAEHPVRRAALILEGPGPRARHSRRQRPPAASSHSRVLPIPGSPPMSTTRPWPRPAALICAVSTASSGARPMNAEPDPMKETVRPSSGQARGRRVRHTCRGRNRAMRCSALRVGDRVAVHGEDVGVETGCDAPLAVP